MTENTQSITRVDDLELLKGLPWLKNKTNKYKKEGKYIMMDVINKMTGYFTDTPNIITGFKSHDIHWLCRPFSSRNVIPLL